MFQTDPGRIPSRRQVPLGTLIRGVAYSGKKVSCHLLILVLGDFFCIFPNTWYYCIYARFHGVFLVGHTKGATPAAVATAAVVELVLRIFNPTRSQYVHIGILLSQ